MVVAAIALTTVVALVLLIACANLANFGWLSRRFRLWSLRFLRQGRQEHDLPAFHYSADCCSE